jgi:synaptojanin
MVGHARYLYKLSFAISRFSNIIEDFPAGVIPIAELEKLDLYRRNNPFDSSEESSVTSSPSSSDEELYTHVLSLPTPMEPVQASTRRPPPPR